MNPLPYAALIAVLLAALGATPAAAQTGNPANTPAGTRAAAPGAPAPNQPNTADRTFVHALSIGGMAEVELGQLADQRTQGQPVKDFARQMVKDHEDADRRLAQLANANGIARPNGLDADRLALRERLTKLNGAAFDAAYTAAQAEEHVKTVQLLLYEIDSGQDPALRNFAAETLPIVERHLQTARDLSSGTATNAPAAATRPVGPSSLGPSSSPQTPPAQGSPPNR